MKTKTALSLLIEAYTSSITGDTVKIMVKEEVLQQLLEMEMQQLEDALLLGQTLKGVRFEGEIEKRYEQCQIL